MELEVWRDSDGEVRLVDPKKATELTRRASEAWDEIGRTDLPISRRRRVGPPPEPTEPRR